MGRSTTFGAVTFLLSAASAAGGCSRGMADMEQANSVVLADLGPEGNAKAIAQYNEFKGKLDPAFVQPEPGTQSLFFSGFRPFNGGTQNVSGQTVRYMAENMTTGPTTSRSVEGGTLTRGVVMQNGKPYTAYFFEGDTNFATPALVAASVEAIKPSSVINMGQTGLESRVEIGASNRANTRASGYDSNGQVSQDFGTNTSNVVDENDRSRSETVYAPDTIKNFAATAKLPLSSKVATTGDYLCNATSYASLMAASNYAQAPGGFEPLPGLKMGPEDGKPLGTVADETQKAPDPSVVGFVHVNEKEVPKDFAPRILESAVSSVPALPAQPLPDASTNQSSTQPSADSVTTSGGPGETTTPTNPATFEGTTPEIGLR